jgi:hypothetical protein
MAAPPSQTGRGRRRTRAPSRPHRAVDQHEEDQDQASRADQQDAVDAAEHALDVRGEPRPAGDGDGEPAAVEPGGGAADPLGLRHDLLLAEVAERADQQDDQEGDDELGAPAGDGVEQQDPAGLPRRPRTGRVLARRRGYAAQRARP